ncbi:uncharacterized protein BJX67DRAFT_223480 [Aspergillus lucknowensis]|uniref:Uncharacterized protein n=1 Tax=Aspergillus lucknowensis TaxID=176173 RepID=A0ABR4LIK4_9EURO
MFPLKAGKQPQTWGWRMEYFPRPRIPHIDWVPLLSAIRRFCKRHLRDMRCPISDPRVGRCSESPLSTFQTRTEPQSQGDYDSHLGGVFLLVSQEQPAMNYGFCRGDKNGQWKSHDLGDHGSEGVFSPPDPSETTGASKLKKELAVLRQRRVSWGSQDSRLGSEMKTQRVQESDAMLDRQSG